ncbi:MAG TPA: YfhO family protein, partial [Candidatus Hydrogenedentes bacterium]|nr:YfhO family protein [Candidatus Hydrogenedentota bacterium]
AQPAVAPEPSAPPAGEAPLTPRVTPSPGTLEERSPERLAVHVEVPQAGIVVLSDSFARGWRASLDGVPCEILRVNGIFRGVAVPAGVHDIVFTYRPASLYLGIGIALFGAALLVGSLLAAAWQRS